MPIKRVSASIEKTPKKSDTIPEFIIPGKAVSEYNQAAKDRKAAEATQELLKPTILADGVKRIFSQNAKLEVGQEPLSSVVLKDETESALRVTFQNKYAVSSNVKMVEKVFADMGRDAGDYVTSGIVIKFNSAVFNHPETGDFDESIYNRYKRAIARATKMVEQELRDEGVANPSLPDPFEAQEAYFVKPEFHKNRFKEFSVAENTELQKVVVATVQVSPIAS